MSMFDWHNLINKINEETDKRMQRLGRGRQKNRNVVGDDSSSLSDEDVVAAPVENHIREDSPLNSLDGVYVTSDNNAENADEGVQEDSVSVESEESYEDVGADSSVSFDASSDGEVSQEETSAEFDSYENVDSETDATQEFPYVGNNTVDSSQSSVNEPNTQDTNQDDVFGSAYEKSKVTDSEQVRQIRNAVDRFDKSSFNRFKNVHEGALKRQRMQERIRQEKIARRQTYKELAISCLFQGESMFDGLTAVAGWTFINLISGGFGWGQNKRTGLTFREGVVDKVDKLVALREKHLTQKGVDIDVMNAVGDGTWFDRKLFSMRDELHYWIGKPMPESVSTLAVYRMGIMARALEDMSAPDADIIAVRQSAQNSMKELYEIAASDGISPSQLNGECRRIGSRLDNAVDAKNRLTIVFDGEPRYVSSDALEKAYGAFVREAPNMEKIESILDRSFADRRKSQKKANQAQNQQTTTTQEAGISQDEQSVVSDSETVEETVSNDEASHRQDEVSDTESVESQSDVTVDTVSDDISERPDSGDTVGERKWYPEDELQIGSLTDVRVSPYHSEDVPACEDVADILCELRERGSYGNVLLYPGGVMDNCHLEKFDLADIVNAYSLANGIDTGERVSGRARDFADTLSEVVGYLQDRENISPADIHLGVDKDMCACVNAAYADGFDLTDPWGEAKHSLELIEAYVKDDGSYSDSAKARENVAIFMKDVIGPHDVDEPHIFGHLGNVRTDIEHDSRLDDVADKLRFAFAAEPLTRDVFAFAMDDLVSKDRYLRDIAPRYFALDADMRGGRRDPEEVLSRLAETFDPNSVSDIGYTDKYGHHDAVELLQQELDTIDYMQSLGPVTHDSAFKTLAGCYKRLRSEFDKSGLRSVIERMRDNAEFVFKQVDQMVKPSGFNRVNQVSEDAPRHPTLVDSVLDKPESSVSDLHEEYESETVVGVSEDNKVSTSKETDERSPLPNDPADEESPDIDDNEREP